MKPINEMNIAECLEALKDIYENSPHDTFDKATDMAVFANQIADRIRELTRWIPVEERLPTEGDADENGFVDIYGKMGRYDMPWNSVGKVNSVTHWKRIDKP